MDGLPWPSSDHLVAGEGAAAEYGVDAAVAADGAGRGAFAESPGKSHRIVFKQEALHLEYKVACE